MADNQQKILLSGIQPSGKLHIGNYFGALKQIVDLQDKYDTRVFIADYHALTTVDNPENLRANILDVVIDYLAAGLNPAKALIYKQSDISEHAELAWIFECITAMPYLERAHAFKDAKANRKEINVGTFNYPMLMSADILLYDVDVVPVGADQKQHVEIARDTAEKFNRVYGTTFALPEPLILDSVKVVPGIDGRKMSKSYGNTIPIFAEDDEIDRLVMSIVTDSNSGIPKNVYALHRLFRDDKELEKIYNEKSGKYKELKEMLAEDMKNFIKPFRERRKEIKKDTDVVIKILKNGGARAKEFAVNKMADVKAKIGVNF